MQQVSLPNAAPRSEGVLEEYMSSCRRLVLVELEQIIPRHSPYAPHLYDLMLDYPLREGKALRPALCIATCRALGGSLEAVAKSAAVLELYHNAFLIHDDVEDGSERRRDQPTLHRQHGTAVAINVGDAMLALALQPLLDNMRVVGMGKALRVLQQVATMAKESAEGQALELAWIRDSTWDLGDRDYLRMVHKKTSWYTFITPMIIGALLAGATDEQLAKVRRLATLMGMAFQIQDDVLNIVGDERRYGKEILGDLWEGKHTLILLHALRDASEFERGKAKSILQKPRPDGEITARLQRTATFLEGLQQEDQVSREVRQRIEQHLAENLLGSTKTDEDIEFLADLIRRAGSVEHARQIARTRAQRARNTVEGALPWSRPSVHYDFIEGLIHFIAERDR